MYSIELGPFHFATSAMHRWKRWIYAGASGVLLVAILVLLNKQRGGSDASLLETYASATNFYGDVFTTDFADEGEESSTFDDEEDTNLAQTNDTKPARHPSKTLKRSSDTSQSDSKYPDWWERAWPKSAVVSHLDFPVGDKPLFPPCQEGASDSKGYPFEEPRDYIARSKNPCWFEYHRDTKEKGLKCAPYFYLAGVAKGGTTDLYRRIRLHPDVMFGTEKEYHWWDRNRYRQSSKDPTNGDVKVHGGMPLKDYLSKITGSGLKQVAAELQDGGSSVKIFGDGSPSYLWDVFYWIVLDGNQGCMEPRVVTGQHIRHFYPNAKIILTFRHPTPRLYSRFLSRIPRTPGLKKSTSEDFHRMVVNGISLYKECYEHWSIRHCAYNHTVYQEAIVRLVEGMYPVFMADWLRIWPREQMLILRYEDYSENMEAILKQVFDFLELAPLNRTQMDIVTAAEKFNVGSLYDKVGKMLPETQAVLDEFYQPFVYKFAELLKDNRFLWQETSH